MERNQVSTSYADRTKLVHVILHIFLDRFAIWVDRVAGSILSMSAVVAGVPMHLPAHFEVSQLVWRVKRIVGVLRGERDLYEQCDVPCALNAVLIQFPDVD
jgi:hypothetical protein